jgi:hypothetical protein
MPWQFNIATFAVWSHCHVSLLVELTTCVRDFTFPSSELILLDVSDCNVAPYGVGKIADNIFIRDSYKTEIVE